MHLRLSTLLGTYEFLPNDVVSLERYGSIPLMRGVRIVHARSDYPSKIVFWCLDPEDLIERIRNAGFSSRAPVTSESQRRGIPVRWTTIVLFLLVWNALFLLANTVVRTVAPIPILLAFLLSWGIRVSPRVQKMVLKEGRSVTEIKAPLLLIQIISGLLLVVFTVLLLANVIPI